MKKRVAFFVNDLYGGGAEKVLQTLLKHLNKEKFDVTLYSLHKEALNDNYPPDITYRYIYGHGKIGDYFKTFIYKLFSPSFFYRLFIQDKFDTEVAFIEGYATRIVSGSTNARSRKIAWVHCNMLVDRWTGDAYRTQKEEERCYNKFDCVVGVSETVKNELQELFVGIKNAVCLYNPIDTGEIIRKSKE